jgi:hypothetical protein
MNAPQRLTASASHQLLRFMHIAFVVSMLMIAGVAEQVRKPDGGMALEIYWAFLGFTGVSAGVYFFFRAKLVAVEDSLRSNPSDNIAIGRRQLVYVLLFAFSEAPLLFGFVVRFMGGTLAQTIPFYAAGFLLLLLSTPRKLD